MKTAARLVLLFFSAAVAFYALGYLDFQVKNLIQGKLDGLWDHVWYRLVFYTHTTFGGLALLSGPTQFWPQFRNKNLRVHRTLGKLYVAACLLGGAAGLILSLFAETGLPAQLGFGTLAVLWLYTTTRAFRAIRRRDVGAHQAWMWRSFALTLAAVTLRLWLPLFTASFGWPFDASYPVIAWLCWAPNLAVAEWVVRRRLAGAPGTK